MILQKLYIHNYKLLKEFKIDFKKPISVFIGINGSGKSSILESLALIFSIAYEYYALNKKTEAPLIIRESYVEYYLRFQTETETETMLSTFNIDYIPLRLTIKKDGKLDISINVDMEKEKDFVEYIYSNYKASDLLPNRIILYYSGMSNHLYRICQSVEEFVLKQLTQNPSTSKHGYIISTKIPMFLFNPTYFNLLFAGLWAFEFNDRINKKLFRSLNISGNKKLITLIIRKIEFDKNSLLDKLKEIDKEIDLDPEGYIDNPDIRTFLIDEYNKERASNFFGATGRLGGFLKQLQETCLSPNSVYNFDNEEYIFEFGIKQWQFLSEEVLQNPKLIFELLLLLKQNNLLKYLKVEVVKEDSVIEGGFLSEGEKQLITITALNEILGTTNSLFLFDEPDNYLHPSLQDDLIVNIESNNDTLEMYQNHYLITTHNPTFLTNLNSNNGELFILSNGKSLNHNLKWFGRDSNDTLHDLMGSEFRPNWATKEIQNIDMLLDTGKIEEGESAFKSLKSKLSGTDIEIVRLQTKLDFLLD